MAVSMVTSHRPVACTAVRAAGRPRPAGRSLYVRRRVVALVVLTVAVLFGTAQAVAAFGAGPASGIERHPAVHIVQPGETLWSIGHSLQPSGDVRVLVQRLAKLNGGVALQAGQRLVLPDQFAAG